MLEFFPPRAFKVPRAQRQAENLTVLHAAREGARENIEIVGGDSRVLDQMWQAAGRLVEALALIERGDAQLGPQVVRGLQAAIAAAPTSGIFQHTVSEAFFRLAYDAFAAGEIDVAIAGYRRALEIRADYADAHYKLGTALSRKGRLTEAIEHLQEAVRLAPNRSEIRGNLAAALFDQGQVQESISEFREAVRIAPRFAVGHLQLGQALLVTGEIDDGLQHMREAARLRPDWPLPYTVAASILASPEVGDGEYVHRAIEFAEQAAKMTKREDIAVLETLASTYAVAGRFEQAADTAEEALQWATTRGDEAQVERLGSQLNRYRQGNP